MARQLTVKERRFVRGYVESGNAADAARRAGYSSKTAKEIGHGVLKKPRVQQAVTLLLEEEGLNDRRLREVHAHLLALYASSDARDRATALRALDIAYRLKGSYPAEKHEVKVGVEAVLDHMTPDEQEHFVQTSELPDRFRPDYVPALPAPEFEPGDHIVEAETVVEADDHEPVARVVVPEAHACYFDECLEEGAAT